MIRVNRIELAALLAVALACRLAVCWFLPSIHHSDELFQAFEPAHRAVFGYGIITWEWRVGARSWLLPGFLAGIFSAVRGFTDDPRLLVFCAEAALSVLSLISIAVAYLWGSLYSRRHAFVAAFTLATWYEFVYFAGRPFGEVVATNFIFLGLLAGVLPTDRRARWFVAGLSLGLAVVLRFQLAPAVAVAAAALAGTEVRSRWLPALAGVVIPVALLGCVDYWTWGVPFHSVVANFKINIIDQRSHLYGVEPFWGYLARFALDWGGALFPIIALALYGSRKAPVLLLFSATCILTHCLIGHKEYRFVFPALSTLILLAAFGSVELLNSVRQSVAAVGIACLGWFTTSIALAVQPTWWDFWARDNPVLQALAVARSVSGLCGVGYVGIPWWRTGGYTYLHRPVPLFLVPPGQSDWTQFNVAVIGGEVAPPTQPRFSMAACFESPIERVVHDRIPKASFGSPVANHICVYQRSGGCSVTGPLVPLNDFLRRSAD